MKILIWNVSNDARFKNNAVKILESQNDGIKIIGEASGAEIAKVDVGGGDMMFSSLRAQKISA